MGFAALRALCRRYVRLPRRFRSRGYAVAQGLFCSDEVKAYSDHDQGSACGEGYRIVSTVEEALAAH